MSHGDDDIRVFRRIKLLYTSQPTETIPLSQPSAVEDAAKAERRATEERTFRERLLEEKKKSILRSYEASQKAAREARAAVERMAAKEKASWERRLEEEKRQTPLNYEAAQEKIAEYAAEAEKKAADVNKKGCCGNRATSC